MAVTFLTEGIILNYRPYNEYNRIITIYTKAKGKIAVSAQGVQKMESKQAGHLEPFTYTELMLIHSKTEFYKLATSTTLEPFLNIKGDLEKSIFASYCAELIEKTTLEQGDNYVFEMFLEVLKILNLCKNNNRGLSCFLTEIFGFKLLSHLGYKPELLQCLFCGKPIEKKDVLFDSLSGGLIEFECFEPKNGGFLVDSDIVELLKFCLLNTIEKILKVDISEKNKKYIIRIIHSFIQTHLEDNLKSIKFFNYI